VHAGLAPGLGIAGQDPHILMSIRTWDGKGDRLNSADDPPWYSFYKGQKPVIYGHWAAAGLTVRRHTIGLDSGCVYGNQLTAYVLETGEIIQVQAKKVYAAVSG